MAQSTFRWSVWVPIIAVVIIGVGVGVGLNMHRGPKVTYPDITSPRPVDGNPSAKVVVQEYSDFQCPACGAAYQMVKDLVAQYHDSIRFEYKQFPLSQIHVNAYNAALASECANDQGKFWPYHDKLFENQSKIGSSDLKQYATDLGLDTAKFNACLDTRAKKKVVDADIQAGNALNVPGTPTFFVNGVMTDANGISSAIKNAVNGAVQGPVK